MKILSTLRSQQYGHLHLTMIFCLIIGVIYSFNPYLGTQLLPSANTPPQATDFAYSFNLVRSFWLRHSPGMYSAPEIAQALHAWLNVDASSFAPIPNPMTPTIVVLWLPMVVAGLYSLEAAFWLWLMISVTSIAGALAQTIRRLPITGWDRHIITLAVLLCCISTTGQKTVTIGQTSLYAVGILTIISLLLSTTGPSNEFCQTTNNMNLLTSGTTLDSSVPAASNRGTGEYSTSESMALGGLLFLSSIKLPYLCIGVSLMIISRRWQALFWCALLCALSVAVGCLWSYPTWFYEYLRTLQRYGSGAYSSGEFWWGGFHSESLIWLNVMPDWIGLRLAHTLNTAAIVFGVLGYTVLLFRSRNPRPQQNILSALRITLATYLLFAPYLGDYEDLLLVVYPLVGFGAGSFNHCSCKGRIILLLVFFTLNAMPLPAIVRFIIKAGVFII